MQFRLLDNKIFYPLAVLVAAGLVALSFVWPQGLGTPSPAPFGHAVQKPDYFRMKAESDARAAKKAADRAARQASDASSASAEATSDAASS